jgi:hypothetical protein
LSGAAEVKKDGRVVSARRVGNAVGETAFLLENPRTADVSVAGDRAQVLSVIESNLQKLSVEEPATAGKLLLNLSKLLHRNCCAVRRRFRAFILPQLCELIQTSRFNQCCPVY